MALLENRPLPAKLLNWVAQQGYNMDKLLGVLDSDITNKQHASGPHFFAANTSILFCATFYIYNTSFQHTFKAGTYGKVYRGKNSKTGGAQTVAIKFADITDKLAFERELEVYSKLAENPHPNLCKLLMHHHVARTACLIFESALMDLREFMSAGQLSPALVPTACLHMALGVSVLHTHHIIHRDLKPNNVLVHITLSGPVFQIADFGTARISGSTLVTSTTGTLAEMTPGFARTSAIFRTKKQFVFAQTVCSPRSCSCIQAAPGYRPPESFNFSSLCKSYNVQFDIWSLGCVPDSQFFEHTESHQVHTCADQHAAAYHTHCRTKVH
jgi:serine/threonine protein kinase